VKTVLCPLPDRDFDTTEVSVPWKLLGEAGHRVLFATEAGAKAACDPLLLRGVIFGKLGADPEPIQFYRELEKSPEFGKPTRWSDVNLDEVDALLLPGGHAKGMRQYLGSEKLQALVLDVWQKGVPTAAICHGVLVLARARDADDKSPLHDVRTTCLPGYMERLAYFSTFWLRGRYYRTYPKYVETEVKEALANPAAQFERGPTTIGPRGTRHDDGPAFVVEDGRYVSARWPGDAYLFAKKLIDRL
jgi:putative intracellular protease/amidase